ncbi:50S ribosomal protein L11 [Candidatus Marsarchaeota archaeon]|jgi:large subunit ribosomal protein L11|nr:50S ribosomal protein L11 [Candidatus Marsarchaeota archaeon]
MSEVIINGLIEGGKATNGPPFGPALGPLGININNVVSEINSKTAAFAGIRVPVKVIVETSNKSFVVEVGSPQTSALIMRELGIQKGAKTKEEVPGDITMEQVTKIAKSKEASLYGESLKDRVTQVLGTCVSMNITCEGGSAKEAIKKVKKGEIEVK